ncbi:MAG TPA: hypothetical protein VGX25_07470 [Actinophytocola sp.]|uniref:hypothetical protein n=1 Tax=Actinophytocola sp. TaxID=1872138 RepID=UPI002DDD8113|nr:hypothetical protein [Actinophytocola sp.]HEV2779225.1 hypothetical protein [Actinophytocola sp.]
MILGLRVVGVDAIPGPPPVPLPEVRPTPWMAFRRGEHERVLVAVQQQFGYACVVGLVAIALGRLSRTPPVPYGPAMIAGAFTVVLVTP